MSTKGSNPFLSAKRNSKVNPTLIVINKHGEVPKLAEGGSLLNC